MSWYSDNMVIVFFVLVCMHGDVGSSTVHQRHSCSLSVVALAGMTMKAIHVL